MPPPRISIVAQWVKGPDTLSMRMWVGSLASLNLMG